MLNDRIEFKNFARSERLIRSLRGELVALARARLGWQYRKHDHSPEAEEYTHRLPQNNPELGVDCSGFLCGLLYDLGYPPKQEARHVEQMLQLLGPRARGIIPTTGGDLLFVASRKNGGNGQRHHCGIFEGDAASIIHASSEHQRVIEEPLGSFLRGRGLLDRVPFKVGRLPDVLELLVEKR